MLGKPEIDQSLTNFVQDFGSESTTRLDFQIFIDNCSFSDQSLSAFPNKMHLKPVYLSTPSIPLSTSTYSPILENSSKVLKLLYEFQDTFKHLCSLELLTYKERYCSNCSNRGSYNLKCGHFNCQNCIFQNAFCASCSSPKSYFDLELDYYICLKCKKFKQKSGQTCKHFCTDCIINILRLQSLFVCSICSEHFNKSHFNEIQVKCESCKKSGSRLEEWFFEFCDNHLMCYDCVNSSIQCSGCMVCEKVLTQKEIYRVMKKMRFNCEACLKSKKVKNLQVKDCCDNKLCVQCFRSSGCSLCDSS